MLNGYTDVVAVELKNPNGQGCLSEEQSAYIDKLEKINVKTLISDNYDQIVKELTEHYNAIKRKQKSAFNFDVIDDENFWLRSLQSKEKLFKECHLRGMDLNKMWKLTKEEIVKELIAYDKTHNA